MNHLILPFALASIALWTLGSQAGGSQAGGSQAGGSQDGGSQDGKGAKDDWSQLTPAAAHAKVAKTFAGACAACHLPPDTKFATDRAWISQLMDTA